MRKIRFIVTIAVSLFLFNTFAQTDNFYKNKFTLNVGVGRVLPHYNFIYKLVQKPTNSAELIYSTVLTGDSIWDNIYKYPELGVKLYYTSLGNDNVFGRELSLSATIKFNIYQSKKFSLYSQPAFGISHVNRSYDNTSNYKNLAIGSKFNAHFDFRLGGTYKVSPKIELTGGMLFGHYSNGNTASPNLGINYTSVYLGVTNFFTPINKPVYRKPNYNDIKESNFFLFSGIGVRNNEKISIPYNLSISYRKNVSTKYLLGGGVEFFYDDFISYNLQKHSLPHKASDNFYMGLFVTENLRYRNVYLGLNQGFYVVDNKIQGLTYFRAEIMYVFLKKYFVRASLKTHSFKADYPEIGCGLKL